MRVALLEHDHRIEVQLEARGPVGNGVAESDHEVDQRRHVRRWTAANTGEQCREASLGDHLAYVIGGHRQQPQRDIVEDLGENTARAHGEHWTQRARRDAHQHLDPRVDLLLDQHLTTQRGQPVERGGCVRFGDVEDDAANFGLVHQAGDDSLEHRAATDLRDGSDRVVAIGRNAVSGHGQSSGREQRLELSLSRCGGWRRDRRAEDTSRVTRVPRATYLPQRRRGPDGARGRWVGRDAGAYGALRKHRVRGAQRQSAPRALASHCWPQPVAATRQPA